MIDRRAWTERLRGTLIPAVPVPRREDGTVDVDAQARYVAYMAARRVSGVAVWAHTGRGLHLDASQRAAVLRAWREGLGPDRVVIAGAGALPDRRLEPLARLDRLLDESVAMAEHARELGADALLAYAPVAVEEVPDWDNDQRDAWIVEYHRRLAAVGLPVIAFYLYEAAGGVSYSSAALRGLFSLEGVIGIKVATLDSVMTFQRIARLIREEFPDILLISGEDRMLGYTLMRGAEAALIGMGAALPDVQAELVRLAVAGEWGRAVPLSNRIDDFAEVTFTPPMEGYIRRMLWALACLGVIDPGAAHDPHHPPLQPDECEAIRRAVDALHPLDRAAGRSAA
ncbi:MAG TPA: dihydrodipicolinate synthase family protein [Limnochordia bacterium]